MQNWKIKRMSYKRINGWIEEMNRLLGFYQRKERLDVCRLCVLVSYACNVCLWKMIENSHCSDFKKKLGLNMDIIEARDTNEWRASRIPMLRRWKKILKAELARRK